MKTERWSGVIHKILGEHAERYIFLDTTSSDEELRTAERSLGTTLPLAASTALRYWKDRASEVLLATLPRLLNPTCADNELNPSGLPMHQLFPTFCNMLAKTEQFGVIID